MNKFDSKIKCIPTSKKKKMPSVLCHNWLVTSMKWQGERQNGERKMEMTGWHLINDDSWVQHYLHAQRIHWLITVQHWCHSSHCTSYSLCFPVSSSVLSVELRLVVMVRKIPIVFLVFLADWLRFISRCSSSSEVMLKCCATLATPAVVCLCRSQPFYAHQSFIGKHGNSSCDI